MLVAFSTNYALDEITLAIFTALAPSGAFACLIIATVLLRDVKRGKSTQTLRLFLVGPMAISLIGLVFSATHLGNPDNALYAFASIGRSPLSNEVAAAVVFLATTGIFWIYGFAEKSRPILDTFLLVCIILSSILFITAVSMAYSVDTIPTWNLKSVPASLWLNALLGGPSLALVTFKLADDERFQKTRKKILLAQTIAAVGNIVVYIIHLRGLMLTSNAVSSGLDLVPMYPLAIALFAILAAVSVFITAYANRTEKGVCFYMASSVCIFLGIALMRFLFYMSHMTVGFGF